MATIIHKKSYDGDDWSYKAEDYHLRVTSNYEISWRYIIAKGNVLEGIEAKW